MKDRSCIDKYLKPALDWIPARPIVESPAPMNFAASCISIFIKCVLYITGMQLTKTNDVSFTRQVVLAIDMS